MFTAGPFPGRPCLKFFNRTLIEKFQSPPQPLHEIREPINRTLPGIFSADPAWNFLSRLWLQKVKRICMRAGPEKIVSVIKKPGKTTRPCQNFFEQTLIEIF